MTDLKRLPSGRRISLYRNRAKEALRWAAVATSVAAREEYERRANHWTEMADDLERAIYRNR